MRFSFTDDQLQLRDAVRGALVELCPPGRVRAAWQAPDDALRVSLAEQGVFAVGLPESVGGLALGAADWVLLAEEAGRAAVPVPVVESLAVGPALVEAGAVELAAQLADGSAFVALEEPGGFALDADRAAAIVAVRDGRVGWLRRPACVPQASVDGARRLFAVDGSFEPMDADVDALLDRASLAASAQLLGLARWMIDTAVAYAKARRQFGKPIGSFQAVQHHLVDAQLRVAFAAPGVYRAAWSLDVGHPNRRVHVAMAKLVASEAAVIASRKALQVHGAIGYTTECDLHLWMKRAWALASAWGDGRSTEDRVADFLLSGGIDG